jgi:flagellar hook-basal body complex protein FliE
MAVTAIAAAAAQLPTTPTLPSTGQIGWSGGTAPAGPQSFGQTMAKAVDSLQGAQTKADNLAVSAATGDLSNVHDYLIAATEASLATELTVAVRNKAVDAFNQIMNMGI